MYFIIQHCDFGVIELQKDGKSLRQCRENVCMDVSLDRNLYAVGSHSYVTLLDCRNLKASTIASKERGCGKYLLLQEELHVFKCMIALLFCSHLV